jgi:hypothetical protein
MGTHWELEGNIERTCWEQRKNEKNPRPPSPSTPPLLPPNLIEKESRYFEWMMSLPIGCMKFLFPELFFTSFNLD